MGHYFTRRGLVELLRLAQYSISTGELARKLGDQIEIFEANRS
jgi:hypothetical protein